ncbi:MAG: tol-pal system protein YbgF [Candidatus Latescibacteria bacterium]|nr:tol-pal system protein YbgF [Candidatus Latescibacterota bacterium]
MNMSILKLQACLICCTVIFVSCATKTDFTEMHRESQINARDFSERLSALESSVSMIDSLIHEQIMLSQSMRAILGTQSREQNENISMITARQDDINYLLKNLLSKLETIQLYGGLESKAGENKSVSAPSSQPSADNTNAYSSPVTNIKPDPEKLYESALTDIEDNNFALAESRFLSFILQFPDHSLAPNAQYWLAESIYAQKKYDLAIKEFETVRKKYSKSPKARAALLKIGFAQIEKGDVKSGRSTLNQVIKSYAKSEEADLAREKLKELTAQ